MSKARVVVHAACLAALLYRHEEPVPVRDRFRDFEPTASFQVREPAPLAYEGSNYQAKVGPEGLTFASQLTLGACEVEQGGRRETLRAGRVSAEGFARARVERGPVVEDYVFENRRAEQLFRIAEPIGDGALTLRVSARSSFGGAIEEISREKGGGKEVWPFAQGIVFRDAAGAAAAMYYGALVFDAAGRSMELDARWERNAIALTVPAEFMSRATYPVTVDPWVEVGTGSASGGGLSDIALNNSFPSVAVDGLGDPVVAWVATPGSGIGEVYVKRWDGAAWVEVGAGSASGEGISVGGGSAGEAVIAVDSTGFPVVAWSNDASEIYARRWNGTAWAELGTDSAQGGGISNTPASTSSNVSIAVDASGGVVVAWQDNQNLNFEVYVRRWNGSVWSQLDGSGQGGGVSQTPDSSLDPSITTDGFGNPIVAWVEWEGLSDTEIYVRRWTGSSWAPLGGSAQSGGVSDNLAPSEWPSLAANASGEVILAWNDNSDTEPEVYVRRWTGSTWEEMGQDSARNGGVSGNSTFNVCPSLALDPLGRPVVAWYHALSGGGIHARRWNGSAWVEIGARSAQDQGLSVGPGEGGFPSLAIGPDGRPVTAWHHTVSGKGRIYVRRSIQAGPAQSKQFQLNGTTFIPVGGTSLVPTVVPKATLTSDVEGYEVRLQIEAREIGTSFNGVPTAEGPLVDSGTEASAQLGPLANGGYHWQARLVDAGGLASEWIAFGGNPENEADFVVDAPAVAPDVVNVESESNCGLLGAEVLLLLAFLRRRRA